MHGYIIIMGSGDGFLMTRSLGKFALKPVHRRGKEADVLINVMCSHSI